MPSARPAILLLAAAAACNSPSLPSAPDDGGSAGDASGRLCIEVPFPTFNKACTKDSDCVVVEHQTNCCGAVVAIGIGSGERSRFESAESSCRANYPICGCAAAPTLAEDGSILPVAEDAGVACVAGRCTSFHKACGAPCPTGRTCLTCPVRLTTYGACSTMCATDADCTNPALPSCLSGTSGMFCAAAGIGCGTK